MLWFVGSYGSVNRKYEAQTVTVEKERRGRLLQLIRGGFWCIRILAQFYVWHVCGKGKCWYMGKDVFPFSFLLWRNSYKNKFINTVPHCILLQESWMELAFTIRSQFPSNYSIVLIITGLMCLLKWSIVKQLKWRYLSTATWFYS